MSDIYYTTKDLIAQIDRAHEDLAKAIGHYIATVCECEEDLLNFHGFDYEQDRENLDDLGRIINALDDALCERKLRLRKRSNSRILIHTRKERI